MLQFTAYSRVLSITQVDDLLEGNACIDNMCMARHNAYVKLLDQQTVCTDIPQQPKRGGLFHTASSSALQIAMTRHVALGKNRKTNQRRTPLQQTVPIRILASHKDRCRIVSSH